MSQDTTTETGTIPSETITEQVRDRYARAARSVQAGSGAACCSGDCCSSDRSDDPVTGNLYDAAQTEGLPEDAVLASLGCGNPTDASSTSRCRPIPWTW